jgi:phosphatidylserine/phosphatidylglycerophosphate/cardiolipin synthase-like enzyme
MANKPRRRATGSSGAGTVNARAYTSPTLVLLAMDWPDGAKFPDFLGFAILRSPGFVAGEKDGYLLNKVGFANPGATFQSLPSNVSPIQKFLWWDSAISPTDRGKEFIYTITPVCGTGPIDLKLRHDVEDVLKVQVPEVRRDGVSTWFNRAVVSSQAFSRKFKRPLPDKQIDDAMKWLANGLEDAFAAICAGARDLEGAIYHLTDNEWVMPALTDFKGKLDVVYEDQPGRDTTDLPAITTLDKSSNFTKHPRSKTSIMHDKFLVDVHGGRVLAGSANFTPEGLTSQANLLHIFESPKLANLYSERQQKIRSNPTIGETAKDAEWSETISIGATSKVRVFFSPEPTNSRVSIDTVVNSVKAAKRSVIFCMFDPTDPALLSALMATSDRGKLLYGLLNSISDPSKTKNKSKKKKSVDDEDLSAAGEPPRKPTASTQIKVELFNRSRKDKKILAYSYFSADTAPAGFLPELSSVNFNSKSTLPPPKPGGKKKFIPAVHIHHKFIVIDAETDSPTIYTGSANLSNNSTHKNDENLLEIKGNAALAQTYFAEFLRLYEHFRARALWNMAHPPQTGKRVAPESNPRVVQTFTLKTRRYDWVKDAYKPGTLGYLARTTLASS